MTEPRPAATVVLLRDHPDGLQTLMLRRAATVGFFPLAWVFPGGRVDAADAQIPTRAAVPGLPEEARPAAVAAVRECLEESGVWLGEGTPPPGLRADLNERRATLLDAPALVPDLSRLRVWSRWITPVLESRRYDTWFVLARVPDDTAASPDQGEATHSAWLRPRDVLDQPDTYPLAPPTFRTLEQLLDYRTAAEALDAALDRLVHPVCPRLDQSEDGTWEIVLPGDPTYPADRPVDGPTRIRFEQGRWWSR